ncbi:hypothetical protein AMECASPLE_035748, partial [Ameca splendens]
TWTPKLSVFILPAYLQISSFRDLPCGANFVCELLSVQISATVALSCETGGKWQRNSPSQPVCTPMSELRECRECSMLTLTATCLSTLQRLLSGETIVTHRAFLDLPTSAITDAPATLLTYGFNHGLQTPPHSYTSILNYYLVSSRICLPPENALKPP